MRKTVTWSDFPNRGFPRLCFVVISKQSVALVQDTFTPDRAGDVLVEVTDEVGNLKLNTKDNTIENQWMLFFKW